MKLNMAIAAGALLAATAGAAHAQMFAGATPRSQNEMMQGPYVSLGGGANWLQTSRQVDSDTPTEYGNIGFRTGWGVNGAIGYAFGFGPRLEVEGSYRSNYAGDNVDGGICNGDSIADRSRMTQLGIMGNAAYDIYTGSPLVPYVGAGIGAVRSHFRLDTTCNEDINSSQWRLAVQAFAGADFLVTQAMRIGLRYTFLHTNDLERLPEVGCCSRYDFDPNNHAITLQVAYNFGAPRVIASAPPAPPPQPALQRNFLVFFDFDKSDITPEADRVIVQAANNAKQATVTRITLTGHTDRAGPVAYNQRLSERRADAVKARLVREGIPANQIVTIGRGESQNLVPTADGVREPQNRRVEIVL